MFSLWSVVTKHANILSPRFKTFLALTKIAARFWCTIWSTYLHLAQCFNLSSRENGCDKDEECGFNEYCTTLLSGLVGGQCRTKLSDGSLCVRFGLVFSLLGNISSVKKESTKWQNIFNKFFRSQECLNTCSGGVCSSCSEDSQCQSGQVGFTFY